MICDYLIQSTETALNEKIMTKFDTQNFEEIDTSLNNLMEISGNIYYCLFLETKRLFQNLNEQETDRKFEREMEAVVFLTDLLLFSSIEDFTQRVRKKAKVSKSETPLAASTQLVYFSGIFLSISLLDL